MVYYPICLTASLSLVLGLRNQFHTRLLSAFFELLRQEYFLLLLKLSHFYLMVPPLSFPAFTFHFLNGLLLLPFHFWTSWKGNNPSPQHPLPYTPRFLNALQSGFCPATQMTWLLWNSSGSCNSPHPVTLPQRYAPLVSLAVTTGLFLPWLSLLILTSKCWNPQSSVLGSLLFSLLSCWSYPCSLSWMLLFVDDVQKHL